MAALPIVGIAPIMVMWFGFDWHSKAAVVVIMVFFPVLVNTVAGLAASERMQRDLMATWGAGYWQSLFKLRLPAAMPFIFNGLEDCQHAGADRRDCGRVFRQPDAGHGVQDQCGNRSHRLGYDLGDDCRGGCGGIGVLRADRADRTGGDVLAPFATELDKGQAEEAATTRRLKMKKIVMGAVFAAFAASGAQAEDVKLQLKWVTQAQFAGYFVAKDKGFYEEEGLNVTILPGGPDVAPTQVIAGGGADVVVDWMPSALAAREKGVPMVNIAQPFKSSGMMLTCLKESGVATPADFADKTLGVWFGGNEYPFLNWMNKLGPENRWFGGRRDGAEARLQRRSAVAKAGGLYFDHDL